MIKTSNLKNHIQKQLPAELNSFLHLAGETASRLGQNLYLAGGVVRDLFLERTNLDLDLVAEGDSIRLAEELARIKNGRVIAYSRFNTAKIKWDKWSVDIACARSEGYSRPGALPTVQPCDIRSDLIRRDFTINAMAVSLNPSNYGELIDLHGGLKDLENGLIRILHDDSFRDDATRIWRAVRYEQRLDFRIEPHTLEILKRDIGYLDTISGDRIRHELELCLEEEKPEKILVRAEELGLLARLCPDLKADDWLVKRIHRARGMLQPYTPPQELYLAFMVYRLSPQVLEKLLSYLNFPRAVSQTLQHTLELKNELPTLEEKEVLPSRIYRCLHRFAPTAILANLLASDSSWVRQRIELYLNNLRYVHPVLTGAELLELDIASGPRIKEILEMLREARMDGRVKSREDELALIAKTGRAAG